MSYRHLSDVVVALIGLALLSAHPLHAQETLLWDNYPDGLQDATYNTTSERNTQVIESTWTVDDVDLDQVPGGDPNTILLTRLVWVGARNPDYTYSKADMILLTRIGDTWNTVIELSDLDYTFTDFDPDPNPDPDTQTYEAELVFEQPLPASELGTHFYVGVRLVGDGWYQGRNCFVTSSIDSTLRGQTQGYVRAAVFGAPDWTPASQLWYGAPPPDIYFEFAFRLYGETHCFGDLDGDGERDLTDLAILLAHYGTPSGMTYENGDLDGDGDVDLSDLGALLAVYGTDCP